MSAYRVEIARWAIKSIATLLSKEQLRVRVGDYRILYEVIDERFVIQVVRVGHRRGVYRSH